MDNQGWISIHRKITDNPIWGCEPFTKGQAWVDLLLLANHKDGYILIDGQRVDVKRGQIGWSVLNLSKRWKWSRGKTTRYLKMLSNDAQIEFKANTKNTIITICNYIKYQSRGTTDSTTHSTTRGHHVVQHADINNNDNNDNNDNKINNNRELAPPIPFQQMIDSWNEKIQQVVKPKSNGVMLTKNRRVVLQSRYKQEFHSNINEWLAYLQMIADTPFLMGDNDRGWAVDIDWALKPANIVKVSEEKYGSTTPREQTREEKLAEIQRNIGMTPCALTNS